MYYGSMYTTIMCEMLSLYIVQCTALVMLMVSVLQQRSWLTLNKVPSSCKFTDCCLAVFTLKHAS